MPGVLDRTVGFLADKLDRRGFLGKAAVVGSAVVAAPLEFGLKPKSAYAAVCSCSGSSCPCGSTCCDGYTEFCCTLNGANTCPPGTVTAGWWKVDGSQFCGGAARYYLDCNAQCGSCGCGGNGVCGGECSGTGCGCANGDCNNRKAGCTRFRYGQCNQHIRCVGPIVCRVVTCTPPWSFDPACGTSARTDEATRYHDKPCLDDPFGALEFTTDVGGAIQLTGWAIANSNYDRAGIRIFLDTDFVYHGVAELPRPDVQAAYPQAGVNNGFQVTVAAPAGRRLVCAWGVDRASGATALLGMREVEVAGPKGSLDWASDVGGAIKVSGWAFANSKFDRAGIRVFLDTDFVYHGVAELPRPDIASAYPGAGANTGYEVTVPAAMGRHLVCVWGVDRSNNSTTLLGMKELDVAPVPIGYFESVTDLGGGRARATGWAVNLAAQDVPAVVTVRVDGAEVYRGATNVARPDIKARIPGANPNSGFSIDFAATPGTHVVCVDVLNSAGTTTSLSCGGVVVSG